MATIDLPGVEEGRNAKETVTNLFDAYIKLRRTVEHALLNLDSRNIKELDANLVRIKNLKAEMIVSNTIITNFLYALDGRIARLTVDHLLTEDLLAGSLTMNYVDIKDQYIRLIQATRNDELPQVQYTLEDDTTLLYWKDEAHTEMTTTETAWPVMVYQYDKLVKREISFNEDGGIMVPMDVFGAGVGSEAHPERGKGFVYKDALGLLFKYIKADGTEVWMRLGENGAEGSLGKDVEVTAIEFNTEGMDVTYADEQVHNWDFVTNGAGRIIRLDNLSTNRSIAISYSGV